VLPFATSVRYGYDEDQKNHLRAFDKRAELWPFVTIVMILAIGTLPKFDAAAPLFHSRHWASALADRNFALIGNNFRSLGPRATCCIWLL
jgi:hypothetical protein